ncbi:hypothetical protein EIP91_009553 [Steccherinum ochraceum]|uniref:AMP-dependent synthetase/ligase domain-containing protein n=1 Tax=Steccherinum ochraceum TaxID=92696 RepID=A0A4R0RTD4_9APHY|nr:hypothetical protein EIP91_009553 [Steccherinum ochraceum]
MAAPYVPFPVVDHQGPLDLEKQSVEVPGTKRPGQTAHYRNALRDLVDLKTKDTPHNLREAFENGLAIAGPNAPCLGERKLISQDPVRWSDTFEWQTWETVDKRRRALGSGLYKLFQDGAVSPGALRTIGIWSRNTANWQLTEMSCHLFNLVTVALYDTLGPDAVEYVINHAETSIVFASPRNIPALLKLSSRTPCLKIIVSMEDLSSEQKGILTAWSDSRGIQLMTVSEIEASGRQNLIPPLPPSNESITTVCYTSGTTGVPKGALLTQGGLAIAARGILSDTGDLAGRPFVQLSYLPLAHIFERVMEIISITVGGCIGFGTGDPLRLVEDIQILKPTLLPSVPRVMNRVVSAAMAASKAGGIKGALFNRALQVKMANFHKNGSTTHAFWDRLVFSKIQAVLGGRLAFMGLGAAPMNADSVNFLKIASNAFFVLTGYGMTEMCGCGTRTHPRDYTSAGFVGPPCIGIEIKLIDVPALGYTSEDRPNPRGEVCLRGVPRFLGYLKDEVNTKAALDEEGWYHSGDVGEMDPKGRLRIIDRVKNIMKLSQGEYVAIERVESLYSASSVVGQLYVHGDSLQSYLVAVLVPDPVQLASIASVVTGTIVALENQEKLQKAMLDPRVVDVLLKELDKEAEKTGLQGFERIKRLHVTSVQFTVEEGTMTPTFKLRRKEAHAKFKQEIDAMYALGEARAPSHL